MADHFNLDGEDAFDTGQGGGDDDGGVAQDDGVAQELFMPGAVALAQSNVDYGLLLFCPDGLSPRFVVPIAMNEGCLLGAAPMLEFDEIDGVRILGVYQVDSRGAVGERQPDAVLQVLLLQFEPRMFAFLIVVVNWEDVDPNTIDWVDEFPFGPALVDVLELADFALRNAGTPITASAGLPGDALVGVGTPIFGGRGGRARARARGRGTGRGEGRTIVGTAAGRRTMTTVSAEVDQLR
jgi:hypothetical protein